MKTTANRGHADVPQEQIERLFKFRSEHPCKHINVNGVVWEYISCGKDMEALLLLPGGLRFAEAAFSLIQMFEEAYHVITPTYPPLDTMAEITKGISAILDAEQVPEAFVLGQSYGGTVAQVLIQSDPSRVKKIVLSGTSPLIVVKWKNALNRLFSSVAKLFPEEVVKGIFSRGLSSVVTAQESEQAFWKEYLDELFMQRLTKADILSLLLSSQDAHKKYVYTKGKTSSWHGDVLVIWGEDDHLRTERGRRGMLEIFPQAQIRVIAGGGHTVALSQPEKYQAIVKGFLDKR